MFDIRLLPGEEGLLSLLLSARLISEAEDEFRDEGQDAEASTTCSYADEHSYPFAADS